ncbi:MAG TPA: hypothetical protein PLM58_09240 [Novosphingobium sp.]|nr:hypothetical protein [Novosphingobium sp.]
MTYEIPLSAEPSQTLAIQLGGVSCRVTVYQKRTGLYVDVSVNDRLVLSGILGRDRTWLVRGKHFGFPGDLTFIDTQGTADPVYTGLGDRFKLVWQA